jgi:conjugative transfer signal peptidase TraF
MTRATILFALSAAVLLGGAAVLAHASGFRINHTSSLPVGLWRIEAPEGPFDRGQIISFCSPDTPFFRRALANGWIGHGGCSGGSEPLLKPILAISGDRIELDESRVAVNGRIMPDSARMALEAGEISTGAYDLQADEIWVMSTFHPRSFDSRYFGAISESEIEGIAKPVWVWP